ncbi:MAG TPA: NAD(P)-binding domain-containing protein [Pyrinomonadaceae bacterium]|nr:NAD(P)-binding domain-containing protein [Pyrinomonadaceae bacterium]
MQSTSSTFVIEREDIAVSSIVLITEGLEIGRQPSCELNLNHPSVSGVHAGIKAVDERYYIYNFSVANDTLLNGRVIPSGETEALADGDVVQIGPFSLDLQPRHGALHIRVRLEVAPRPIEARVATTTQLRETTRLDESTAVDNALEIYWQRRKREEGKFHPRSLLQPRTRTRLGKAKFNWKPTVDLIPRWPLAIFTWALLIVALLSCVAALQYPEFFSLGEADAARSGYPATDSVRVLLPYKLLLYGTGGAFLTLCLVGVAKAVRDSVRLRHVPIQPPPEKKDDTEQLAFLSKELLAKYDPDSPDFPHPVIVTDRCIGCHACVDACPHDVLAIINGVATPVARDQCMEDMSCQIECPVNPKACIVINTTKKIPRRRVPIRNSSFETNVPGCYLIGDVSGTPLIKNAANEGAVAMIDIAHRLRAARDNGNSPVIDYDVVIVGAGPGGVSATIMAKKLGLRYLCLEQDTVMSTIVKYARGKYVFLKPETLKWAGGLWLPGLEEYVEEVLEEVVDGAEKERVKDLLAAEREGTLDIAGQRALAQMRYSYQQLVEDEFKVKLDEQQRARLFKARRRFAALLEAEEKYKLGRLPQAQTGWRLKDEEADEKSPSSLVHETSDASVAGEIAPNNFDAARYNAFAAARLMVTGVQREVLLNSWFMNMREHRIQINEKESCKAIKKAEDGDYFFVQTERVFSPDQQSMTYRARRVVIAIGNAGSPMRLRVPGETYKVRLPNGMEEERIVQVERAGVIEDKIKYKLTNWETYRQKKIIVVGAGNAAVEAAVDLVTYRMGEQIRFRPPDETNEVTLIIRSDLKNDLKFINKVQVYNCIDEGKIKVYFGTAIKEIRDDEVVLMSARTQEVKATVKNDFIFVMIGAERPTKFLESIGIKID